MAEPDAQKAADALGILLAGRKRVRQQTRREKALSLGAAAALTVLGYARKDVANPALRRLTGLAWLAGSFAYGAWQGDGMTVLARGPVADLAESFQHVGKRIQRLQEEDPSFRSAMNDPEVKAALLAWRPVAIKIVAFGVTTAVAEALVVTLLRRSKLRYPNVAAGVVLAVSRTAIGWFEVGAGLVRPVRAQPEPEGREA